MKQQIMLWTVVLSVVLSSTIGSHSQDVRTQAPCSPVVDRTQGNVTPTFSGGCTAGITPAELKEIIDSVLAGRAIPPALLGRYETVSRQFGVTDAALATFLRILGESNVATEDLDAKLREVAARHLTLLQQAEASADDDSQVAAIKKEASAAIGAGDYARAEPLLRGAFDADLVAAARAQDLANKQYLAAAKTRAELGLLNVTQLRHAAAIEDFQDAVSLVPAGYAPSSLGPAAAVAGNLSPAYAAWAEAVSLRERLLDPDHPDVAISLTNLASLLRRINRPNEAEPLYRRALAIQEKSYGPDHPAVAIRLDYLAALLRQANRQSEAEPLYRRALAIDEKAYGPDHPAVAFRLDQLAGLLRQANRQGEAEPLYRRALAIDENSRGPDHPTVAIQLDYLAALLWQDTRLGETEPLYRRALAIEEKRYGPDHPAVAIRLNYLAALLRQANRLSEAEPLYRRALAIIEKTYGPDHPAVAIRLDQLAALLRQANRLSEAEPLYRRALAIEEKSYGPDHPAVAIRLNYLAGLLRQANRLNEAEPLYERALAINEKSHGEDHPDTKRLSEIMRSLHGSSASPNKGPSVARPEGRK
jgi:hypothetical protein